MRQLNFLTFLALCLVFVLFSLQNAAETDIVLVPGLELRAPLSVELLLAMGIGSVLAWMFGLWGGVQNAIARFRDNRELRKRDKQIQELQDELTRYRMELEQRPLAVAPGSDPKALMQAEIQPTESAEIQDAEFETAPNSDPA
jgi:uncharacterized integral membrane protein